MFGPFGNRSQRPRRDRGSLSHAPEIPWRLYSPFQSSVTSCGGEKNINDAAANHDAHRTPAEIRNPEEHELLHKERIEQLQKDLDEPCSVCMYTGVATCTGLSVYFAYLATDPSVTKSNRRFQLACSAFSVVAGAYRWYLG